VPQEELEQEPQPPPPDDLDDLAVPCPTSGVVPPARINAFQILVTSVLPHLSQAQSVDSAVIDRSTVKTSRQSLHR